MTTEELLKKEQELLKKEVELIQREQQLKAKEVEAGQLSEQLGVQLSEKEQKECNNIVHNILG
mgnify:FL=1